MDQQPQMNQTTTSDSGGTNTVLIVIVIIIILVGGYFLFMRNGVAPAPADNGGVNIDVTLPANSDEQPPAGQEAVY